MLLDKSSGVEDPEKPGYLKYTSGSLPGIVWIKNQCTHCSAKLHRHTRQRSGNIKLDSLTNNDMIFLNIRARMRFVGGGIDGDRRKD